MLQDSFKYVHSIALLVNEKRMWIKTPIFHTTLVSTWTRQEFHVGRSKRHQVIMLIRFRKFRVQLRCILMWCGAYRVDAEWFTVFFLPYKRKGKQNAMVGLWLGNASKSNAFGFAFYVAKRTRTTITTTTTFVQSIYGRIFVIGTFNVIFQLNIVELNVWALSKLVVLWIREWEKVVIRRREYGIIYECCLLRFFLNLVRFKWCCRWALYSQMNFGSRCISSN